MFIDTFNTRTRAFVKIQDGCENFCSYCVIPKVRGKCRSKKMDVALKEIETLVNNGYKEIILTGIHTGNYGVDLGLTCMSYHLSTFRIRVISYSTSINNINIINIIKLIYTIPILF